MRTLLTGAGGYVGLHLLRALLADGHDVTAFVRAPERLGPFARDRRVEVVVGDLEDRDRVAAALPGHELLVHAAILWGEPGEELELHDVVAAAHLFDAAGRAGVDRAIYLSSAAVHRPFAGEMSEADPLRTADLYGATKAAGELFLRAAGAQHGMATIVVRPGPIVGPPAWAGGAFRSPERITEMVRAALAGRAIEVLRGDGRQLSDVADVAAAVRLLARVADPLPTYVCVEREVSTWERIARLVVGCVASASDVRVVGEGGGPVPRFRTDRIEGLLCRPLDAEGALRAHVRHLAASLERR